MNNIKTIAAELKTTGKFPFTDKIMKAVEFLDTLGYDVNLRPREVVDVRKRTLGKDNFPTLSRNRLWYCDMRITEFYTVRGQLSNSVVARFFNYMEPGGQRTAMVCLNDWINYWKSDYEFQIFDRLHFTADRFKFGTAPFFYHISTINQFEKFELLCEDISHNSVNKFPMDDVVVHLLRSDLTLYVDDKPIEYNGIRQHMLKMIEQHGWKMHYNDRKELYKYFAGDRWQHGGIPWKKWYDFISGYGCELSIKGADGNSVWFATTRVAEAALA